MQLYDSLTRAKVELPQPPGQVRMYFCGPTVYQRIHVGNARPFVVSMWLRRWLEQREYDVTLVENITDINDKIYLAAPETARGWLPTLPAGISRTPACSGSAARITNRRRPRRSPRSCS